MKESRLEALIVISGSDVSTSHCHNHFSEVSFLFSRYTFGQCWWSSGQRARLLTSNPVEVYYLIYKVVVEKNKKEPGPKKRPGLAHFENSWIIYARADCAMDIPPPSLWNRPLMQFLF